MAKCKYCDADATKRVIWADGRAQISVCAKHVKNAKATIAKNGDKVSAIKVAFTNKMLNQLADETYNELAGEIGKSVTDLKTLSIEDLIALVDKSAETKPPQRKRPFADDD